MGGGGGLQYQNLNFFRHFAFLNLNFLSVFDKNFEFNTKNKGFEGFRNSS